MVTAGKSSMFGQHIPIEDAIQVDLPQMTVVRQRFGRQKLDDVRVEVLQQLDRPEIANRVVANARIAVGVGSRGIANISEVVTCLVEELKRRGADPFIFPAMGSHGSATAEGQIKVLANLGITQSSTGVEIKSTLDTQVLGAIGDGTDVHIDAYAADADGIVLVNRIKPHTTFRGSVGSGITKMMVVGMGNITGATAAHNHRVEHFIDTVKEMAELIIKERPFLFGLGLIENAYDETAVIEAVPSEVLLQREAELYHLAAEMMGKLHFEDIDVLVVERMGKDISGAGIDPNITGRNNRGVEGFCTPRVEKIVVLSLTEETQGSVGGIGLVDVIPRSLYESIDFAATYANVITAGFLDGALIPIIMSTARKAVMLAVRTVPMKKPEEVRIVWIRDTLTLDEIKVSPAMLEEAMANPDLEVVGERTDWTFSDDR